MILFGYGKDVQMTNQKAIIEGLLFLSGEDGLTLFQIQSALEQSDVDAIFADLEALKEEYSHADKGFELVEYANRCNKRICISLWGKALLGRETCGLKSTSP